MSIDLAPLPSSGTVLLLSILPSDAQLAEESVLGLQDLAAVGEAIGGLAVLVTLVYLSIQTRQTRIAAEETAKFSSLRETYSIVSMYVEARRTLLAHSDLITRANGGAELSEDEGFALSIVFHDLFYGAAYSYASASNSGSVHAEAGDIEYFTGILKSNPSALAEWDRIKENVELMGPGFVPLVESVLDEEKPN